MARKMSGKKTGAAGGAKNHTRPMFGHGKGNLPAVADQKTMKKKSKKVGNKNAGARFGRRM